MKVCGGCEHEYDEDYKFCPLCGREFGGSAARQETERLNQHLRSLAAAGNAELRLEQQFRRERAFDRPATFDLSEGAQHEAAVVTDWIVTGRLPDA